MNRNVYPVRNALPSKKKRKATGKSAARRSSDETHSCKRTERYVHRNGLLPWPNVLRAAHTKIECSRKGDELKRKKKYVNQLLRVYEYTHCVRDRRHTIHLHTMQHDTRHWNERIRVYLKVLFTNNNLAISMA